MEDEAFVKAICDAPDDETARLVYADWLDERGDIRGEFIRLEHQLAHLPARLEQLGEQIDRIGLHRLWLHRVSRRRLKCANGYPTADWLWEVMAAAQQNRDKLRPLLHAMTEQRLEDFCYEYWNAAYELYPSHEDPERELDRDKVLDAADWVVAHGREFYEAVWANPRLLPHSHTIVSLHYLSLAAEIFWDRFGRAPNY